MMTWPQAHELYFTAMQAAGRSAGTIALHRHYLGSLMLAHPRSPVLVTTAHLLTFLAVPHWAPETRKSARAAVRSFYRFLHGAGHIEDDPSLGLPSVRVPPAMPRPTPEHLVAQLVRDDGRVGFMAMLAAYGGLRAAEVARVHGRDLLGDVLTVHGKGGKVRAVPVVSYPLRRRLEAVGDGWAFPNGRGGHLSPGHVSRLLSRALPEGWTAHTLRHRMATTAYAGTRDLLAVGAVLGHSRPETTQRYVLLPDDALRRAVAAAC
jgi:integrase/recombinase XerC